MLFFDILVSIKKLSSSHRYFQTYVGYDLWCNILIGIFKGFEWRSKVRIGAGLCRIGGGVEAISGLIDNPHHTLLVLLLLYILAFDIFLPPNSVSCCTRTKVALRAKRGAVPNSYLENFWDFLSSDFVFHFEKPLHIFELAMI